MAYKSNSIEQSHNLLEIVACELSVKGGRDEGREGGRKEESERASERETERERQTERA